MSVSSVLVFYRPKDMKYGMYECERAAETEARENAQEAARKARQTARRQTQETARREIEREDAREIEQNPFYGIHPGIRCDLCGQNNIYGVRQKCDICDDFDVCGECFEIALKSGPGSHEHSWHDFTKMRRKAAPVTRTLANRGGTTRGMGATRGGSTRGGDSDDGEYDTAIAAPPPQPRLHEDIESGFDLVNLLDFFLPGYEQYGSVTKHDAVSTAFYEKVKTRLRHNGRCPVTSGHVRIPFGLTIEGRIPQTGVALGARPIGAHKPALTCHLMHMREGLFMEYLDAYHGIPETAFAVRDEGTTNNYSVKHNIWLMETLKVDTYILEHFTERSKIIPDPKDVKKLIDTAVDRMNPEREMLAASGASEDEVEEVKSVVQHDVRTRFEAGTAHAQYATMAAAGVLFPHVPGYDIAAIIPVTLRVQVVVGACDICSSTTKHMTRLCANKHEMCVDCVAEWKRKRGTSCPFCRSPLLDGTDDGSCMDFSGYRESPYTFGLDKLNSSMYNISM